MSLELDLKSIQTRWVLGLIHGSELPGLATDLLCQGIHSKYLHHHAGLSPNEGGAIALFEQALDELGCGFMEPTEALRRYAKAVSTSILASEVSPLEGANLIWQAKLHVAADGFHDVDPFVYAASEAETRPQDRDFFEQAIVEEAKRWNSAEF